MEFRILGPLEVRDNGRVLELGGAKQRAVLALLLLRANEVVSLDRLIDGIWGERPPDTAAAAVHGSVSRLRKVLEPNGAPYHVIRTQAPGYVFAAGLEVVDRYRFERLAAEGKTALEEGEAARSADLLRQALALWRGPALADIAFTIADRTELDRLEEEWLSAVEERIDADLALGRQALLVPELEALVARHPVRASVFAGSSWSRSTGRAGKRTRWRRIAMRAGCSMKSSESHRDQRCVSSSGGYCFRTRSSGRRARRHARDDFVRRALALRSPSQDSPSACSGC